MTEADYDENGFREDLKNSKDVLHQPDADRSAWDLKVLDYDQTLAVLNGKLAVKPNFSFADDVLKKIREEKPQIDSDEDLNSVIEDKYQQILLARYNEDQAKNVSRKIVKDDDE
ncbi:hypothetical protein KZE55_05370 [Limosilactobacillus panis]|uniref:hypothetical protein n=1 Tax=Limosilactobacillus panis TaxID=47493 RepID=UPI001C974005|nr:hypothetical protein [Limosilactobacillus panis]QZN92264.1 hypothetical protein KZE55_05370 [Limosilactobacillus panis]